MSHAVESGTGKPEHGAPKPQTNPSGPAGPAPERTDAQAELAAGGDAGSAGDAGRPNDAPARADFLAVADPAAREHVLERLQAQQGNRFVQRVVAQQVATKRLAVQRETPPGGTSAVAPAPGAAQTPGAATPASGLIVDDATPDVTAQQMKRSAFLAQLRTSVFNAVEQAVGGSPWAAIMRPQINQEIEKQFSAYGGMDGPGLERTIKAQVPGAAGATSAAAFIPLISAQVQQNVNERLPKTDSVGSLANAGGAMIDTVASGISGALDTLGSILFKADAGGAHEGADPRAVQNELGEGQTLEPSVRSPMEAAFGEDFSSVRVHTGDKAAQLSDNFNARAFTIGNTIAFGAGEYHPGSPVGDALVAHELAHVAQQRGAGAASLNPMGPLETNALEEDADRTAIGVVGSLWGGIGNISQNAVPSLRAGLRLQRCSKDAPAPTTDVTPTPTATTPKPPPPPKPLHEQYTTGPERQKAVDDATGKLGGQVDTSLLEGGRFNYNGAVPGGDGNTYPPNDKTLAARKKPNKKPYVEIYGGAFASTMAVLMSTIYHEFQHVKQMTKGQKTIVPGVSGNSHAQEVEAYASEIIAAEEHGLDADYVKDPLWRRLNDHYNKTRGPSKAQVTPIYNQAKAAYEKITAGK